MQETSGTKVDQFHFYAVLLTTRGGHLGLSICITLKQLSLGIILIKSDQNIFKVSSDIGI